LLYCFGGCPTENVLAVLGWTKADLYDNHRGYVYTYPDGAYAHRSYDTAGRKKFHQSGTPKATALSCTDSQPSRRPSWQAKKSG
jgi:hypothetical protein